MTRRLIATSVAALALTVGILAQGAGRRPSPAGSSAAQVGGRNVPGQEGPVWDKHVASVPFKVGS